MTRLRTVETLEDIGTVLGSGLEESRVRYSLQIQQKLERLAGEEVPGLYHLTGAIEPLDVAPFVLMTAGNLVVTLSDGRQCRIFVTRIGSGDTRCDIALNDKMTLLRGLEENR